MSTFNIIDAKVVNVTPQTSQNGKAFHKVLLDATQVTARGTFPQMGELALFDAAKAAKFNVGDTVDVTGYLKMEMKVSPKTGNNYTNFSLSVMDVVVKQSGQGQQAQPQQQYAPQPAPQQQYAPQPQQAAPQQQYAPQPVAQQQAAPQAANMAPPPVQPAGQFPDSDSIPF